MAYAIFNSAAFSGADEVHSSEHLKDYISYCFREELFLRNGNNSLFHEFRFFFPTLIGIFLVHTEYESMIL